MSGFSELQTGRGAKHTMATMDRTILRHNWQSPKTFVANPLLPKRRKECGLWCHWMQKTENNHASCKTFFIAILEKPKYKCLQLGAHHTEKSMTEVKLRVHLLQSVCYWTTICGSTEL